MLITVEDGFTLRMHQDIMTMGTYTFRHSIRNPSLQNIPSDNKYIGPLCKRIISSRKPTPTYTITDDKNNKWVGKGTDFINTKRGQILFSDLIDSDEIV